MQRRELVDLCIERAGVRRGSVVALRLIQWATVAAWIGHFPYIREFAAETFVSMPTAERYRMAIRAAFTEEEFRVIVEQLVEAGVVACPLRDARKLAVAI